MTPQRLSLADRSMIAVPLVWLLALLAVPLLAVSLLSVHVIADAIPPIEPLVGHVGGHFTLHASMRAFHMLGTDVLYRSAFLSALINAALTMIGCVIIGFPIALAIAQAASKASQLVRLSRHSSVLDLVSPAGVCVDWIDTRFGSDQFGAVVLGIDQTTDSAAVHTSGRSARDGVFLFALLRVAHVCGTGDASGRTAGGGR